MRKERVPRSSRRRTLLETNQVYRAGYAAGGGDALLGEYGASFDESDDAQWNGDWERGYEAGWKQYSVEGWMIPEWE